MLLSGGSKVCPIGCVGLGTCARACPFVALSMGPDNLPVVNLAKCTGCGTCERICPKNIITLTSNSRRIGREAALALCSRPNAGQRHLRRRADLLISTTGTASTCYPSPFCVYVLPLARRT